MLQKKLGNNYKMLAIIVGAVVAGALVIGFAMASSEGGHAPGYIPPEVTHQNGKPCYSFESGCPVNVQHSTSYYTSGKYLSANTK